MGKGMGAVYQSLGITFIKPIHHRTDFSAQLKKDGTSREDCGRL